MWSGLCSSTPNVLQLHSRSPFCLRAFAPAVSLFPEHPSLSLHVLGSFSFGGFSLNIVSERPALISLFPYLNDSHVISFSVFYHNL